MICVRCINYSNNNMTKGIRLLDKKVFLFIQEIFIQVRAFESCDSLRIYHEYEVGIEKPIPKLTHANNGLFFLLMI